MGCNQSQSDDVRRDAERRRIQQQRQQQQQRAAVSQQQQQQQQQNNKGKASSSSASSSTPARSASTPISSPKANNNNFQEEVQVGASYTDSRMEEHDYFKDIIDKTEARFIDVNDADGFARDRDAGSLRSAAAAGGVAAPTRANIGHIDVAYSLTRPAMPLTSERPRDVASLLAAPPLATDAQRAALHDSLNALCDAVRAVSIEDRGQLVVPWRTEVE